MPRPLQAELELRRRLAKLGQRRAKRRKVPRSVPSRAVQLEYQRELHAILAELWSVVERDVLPRLPVIVSQGDADRQRTDSASDEIQRAFAGVRAIFGTAEREEKIVRLTKKIGKKGVDEGKKIFQRQISAGLGVEIITPDSVLAPILDGFVASNLDLVGDLTRQTERKMRLIVSEGVRAGTRAEDLAKSLRDELGMNETRAALIARDQTLKLFGDLAETQQQAAGITEYEWGTSQDERVRESHQVLNETRHKWSDPPVVDPRTGRRAHPGGDYSCRCVAIPVMPE